MRRKRLTEKRRRQMKRGLYIKPIIMVYVVLLLFVLTIDGTTARFNDVTSVEGSLTVGSWTPDIPEEETWDKSSLSFVGGTEGNCQRITATVKNTGETMESSWTYHVYHAANLKGKPDWQRVADFSGETALLDAEATSDITYEPEQNGRYRFKFVRPDGHPGGDNGGFSEAIKLTNCGASDDDKAEKDEQREESDDQSEEDNQSNNDNEQENESDEEGDNRDEQDNASNEEQEQPADDEENSDSNDEQSTNDQDNQNEQTVDSEQKQDESAEDESSEKNNQDEKEQKSEPSDDEQQDVTDEAETNPEKDETTDSSDQKESPADEEEKTDTGETSDEPKQPQESNDETKQSEQQQKSDEPKDDATEEAQGENNA
ncbi:YqxM protein [Alkalibacillus flavidus]|uniref:YqxM protein n=1 Tax=Alkalibacillus flavidus TaxID=546021 RepID=A0ABV2L078_9BACI